MTTTTFETYARSLTNAELDDIVDLITEAADTVEATADEDNPACPRSQYAGIGRLTANVLQRAHSGNDIAEQLLDIAAAEPWLANGLQRLLTSSAQQPQHADIADKLRGLATEIASLGSVPTA